MSKSNAAFSNYESALHEMEKERPDVAEAQRLLSLSVDGGCVEAIYALATWYLHGANGLLEDFESAEELGVSG